MISDEELTKKSLVFLSDLDNITGNWSDKGMILDQLSKEFISIRDQAFKEGIKKAAQALDEFIEHPYTSDTGTECDNARTKILALLTPQSSEEKK